MAQRDEKKLNGAGLGVLWTRITQLLGMKTFGGVPLSTGHRYSVCSTAAGTAAKTVTLTGFSLVVGAEVTVRFTSTNTAAAANLTLNVNSTGAKGIRYRNAALPGAAVLETGRTYTFVYDGTYWQMEGDLNTDTTYQKITQSEIIAGTDTNGKTCLVIELGTYVKTKVTGFVSLVCICFRQCLVSGHHCGVYLNFFHWFIAGRIENPAVQGEPVLLTVYLLELIHASHNAPVVTFPALNHA